MANYLNTHPFAYPPELAAYVLNRWAHLGLPPEALPPTPALALILAMHYHASFLQEEGRQVLVRSVLGQPADFLSTKRFGDQLHILSFGHPRRVHEQELRRLCSAANPYRSMLGMAWNGLDGFDLWGMIGTGTRWLSRTDGGRFAGAELPQRLVIQILGPGRLRLGCGYDVIAEIVNGTLREQGMDPMRSLWLPRYFLPARRRVLSMYEERKPVVCAQIDEEFVLRLSQNAFRRILSLVRNGGHGGMLLFVPQGERDGVEQRGWLRYKYRFSGAEAATRYPELLVAVMIRLGELGREAGRHQLGWDDYQSLYDQSLGDLDEDLFELAHWMAEMMSVDGALVLSDYFEILGFGAELTAPGAGEEMIHRALDLEGETTTPERVDQSGTRHRSAYRFCHAQPGSLALVVSQDGQTRVMTRREDEVTYWPYAP